MKYSVEMSTTYYCFSEKGEIELPTQDEIDNLITKGVKPVIFLDSCVCLHIIKVVDYAKKATNVDLARIIHLKEYLEEKSISISPFFGLLELCMKNGLLDEQKHWDFRQRIKFFEQIPLKAFKKFKYDFSRDFFLLKEHPKLVSPPMASFLNNTYCALLKIRELALNGLSKDLAEANIYEFLDWMSNDLNMILAIEYKLAMSIFGGITEFRKMIGLDRKNEQAKKALLGTTWDIFHARNTSNSFRLFKMLDQNISPVFMTSDGNLFRLLQKFSLTLIKDGGDTMDTTFLFNSGFDYPHLERSFISEQNRKMLNLLLDRHGNEYEYDHNKVSKLITELEIRNGVS